MKKLLFLSILLATVFLATSQIPHYDKRVVSQCGFTTPQQMQDAIHTVFIGTDETSVIETSPGPNSTVCFKLTITCVHPSLAIPALPAENYSTCSKTIYGPASYLYYGTYDDAMNAGKAWVVSKTDIFADPPEVTSYAGTEPGELLYKVTINYTRAGKCY